MARAWGASWGDAWADDWLITDRPTPPPATEALSSGGFLPPRRRKTKKRIQEERERLGILPAPAPEAPRQIEPEPPPETVAEPVYLELSETKSPAKPTLTQLLAIEKGLRQQYESQLRALEEQDEEDLLALL